MCVLHRLPLFSLCSCIVSVGAIAIVCTSLWWLKIWCLFKTGVHSHNDIPSVHGSGVLGLKTSNPIPAGCLKPGRQTYNGYRHGSGSSHGDALWSISAGSDGRSRAHDGRRRRWRTARHVASTTERVCNAGPRNCPYGHLTHGETSIGPCIRRCDAAGRRRSSE